jgi:hypothetical protein
MALGVWAIKRGFLQHVRNTYFAPSVNLVVAATSRDDLRWITRLTIPNLNVIPYIADNSSAPFHAAVGKGNEALSYLTYLHENYHERLPDISIFVHSTDNAWHVDHIFDHSIVKTLNSLDLNEVVRRRYLNLHVGWTSGCPAWINTTDGNWSSFKMEEPFMA